MNEKMENNNNYNPFNTPWQMMNNLKSSMSVSIITETKEYGNIENDDDSLIRLSFNNNIVNYNYDSLGRLINSNINNSYNSNYEYETNGNRTSLLIKSLENNGRKLSYRYDNLNNISHIYQDNILINKYYYDKFNQLIKEHDIKNKETILYKYNSSGNLLYKKTYELNTFNLKKQDVYKYENQEWEDSLTEYNDETIIYDDIGNPITIGNNIVLTWNNGRELSSYVDQNNTINYKYNDEGLRVNKTINNVEKKYLWESNKLIIEKTNSNVLYFIYSKDEIIGFKYNQQIYYYEKNIQNDVVGIIDSNYNVIATYEYDSWGNILSIKDNNNLEISNNKNHIANINPYRYRSYYYDIETNLYYLNSRYYNPLWQRFINIDLGIAKPGELNGYNLYLYAFNNPITYSDESGKWPKWIKKALKVAAIVAVAAVTVAAIVVTAPVVANIAGTSLMYYGASLAAAKSASAIATIVCASVAVSTASIGINRSVETITNTNYGEKILGENAYADLEAFTFLASTAIISSPAYGTYPSTGRGAQNSIERNAMNAAKSHPSNGEVIVKSLSDQRMPGWLGWQKYKQPDHLNGVDVHYVGNKFIPFFFDFKIKDKVK